MENELNPIQKVEHARVTMNEQQNHVQSLLDMTSKMVGSVGEVLERVEHIRQLSLTANSLSEVGETKIEAVVQDMNHIHSRAQSIM